MIDLQSFCAGYDDPRYYLRQPFSLGAYSMASNGHIVVFIPRRHDISAATAALKFNPTETLDKAIKKRGTSAESGSLRLADFNPACVTCSTCGGTGKTYICPSCNGRGDRRIETFTGTVDDVECELCDHSGVLTEMEMLARRQRYPDDKNLNQPLHSCQSCMGLGKQPAGKNHRVGETLLANRYLLLIKQHLPNAIVYAFWSCPDPALIVFTGGLGLLAPMRY
jgi:hypothetical protein